MDVGRLRNRFKSYDDDQLQWFKEQYEFDIYIEDGFPISEEEKSGAKTFLKLINEEIEFREKATN